MEQNKLLSDIRSRIYQLQAQINSISSQPDTIYRIDIEYIKQNIIKLYDLLHQLEPTVITSVEPAHDLKPAAVFSSKPTVSEEPDLQNMHDPKLPTAFSEPIESDIEVPEPDIRDDYSSMTIDSLHTTDKPEPVDEEIENIDVEDRSITVDLDVETEDNYTASEAPSHPHQATTLDLFGDIVPESLGEMLVIADEVSIAARMQRKKIDDLRAAIGINEKFLFINELFGGNLNQYNKTIIELNDFKSLAGARTYLIELSVQHQWPAHSLAITKLNDLIERKFLTL